MGLMPQQRYTVNANKEVFICCVVRNPARQSTWKLFRFQTLGGSARKVSLFTGQLHFWEHHTAEPPTAADGIS